MRGLQTRCDFAAAKISLAIYPDADDPYAGMACAVTDAECLGYGDYQVGVHTVPTLFRAGKRSRSRRGDLSRGRRHRALVGVLIESPH